MPGNFDLGLGFDGDGDRLGVVDADGRLIYGDQLMILFSREILSRKPGATFISEVKCSQTMYDDIAAHGGRAIMWKTGHSMIKQKMKEEKAALAGEMSGHIFFADRYMGFDDATYAACRLLEIRALSGRSIGAMLADVPRTYNTPEIRVECADNIKFDVVARVTDHFRGRQEVIDIDGARILFGDGWGLVPRLQYPAGPGPAVRGPLGKAPGGDPQYGGRGAGADQGRLPVSPNPAKGCYVSLPSNRHIFIALFFSLFATTTGVGLVVPLLPVYAHDLGATGIYIALIFSAFSLSRTCLLPYFGRQSDRHGRKPFIVVGMLAYAAGLRRFSDGHPGLPPDHHPLLPRHGPRPWFCR